jgi:thiol-disulfide isomerase/thioredoxin
MIEPPAQAPESAPRRSRLGLWIVAAGLALVLVGIALWWFEAGRAGGASPGGARIGFAAPQIILPQLQNGKAGPTAALSSLQGRPVVVNFWATWCGPCRAEFPAFQAAYVKFKDARGLVIVGVDAQGDGGPDQVQEFVTQMGATYPIWLTHDGSTESAYRVDALPTTFFVDRRGVIQDMIVGGPMTADRLEKELQKIF